MLDIEIVQESPIRDRHKGKVPIYSETPHIAFDKLHTVAYIRSESVELISSDHQHVVRGVEPDDFDSGVGRRDEEPAGATAQLEDWGSGAPSLFNVESDVAFNAGCDEIVVDGVLTRVL